MYKKIFLLVLILIFMPKTAFSQNISVDTFDEFINIVPSNGDIITFTSNLEADETIGNHFSNYSITYEGDNHYITGNDLFGGFMLEENSLFHSIGIRNCQGQLYGLSKYAGAIYNDGSDTTINDSIFNNNFADAAGSSFSVGGALYNLNDGIIHINNSQFIDNYTNGGSSYGGAIANGYQSGEKTIMYINNSSFSKNYSYGTVIPYGGAIYNNGQLYIDTSEFDGNYTSGEGRIFSYGGAIYNIGDMEITNTTLSNNYAEGTADSIILGGAIFNEKNITIENSHLYNNHVDSTYYGGGGAFFNGENATATIKNSLFENNSITSLTQIGDGGAVLNSGILNIESTTFQNNRSKSGELNDIFNRTQGIINFQGSGENNILSGIYGGGSIYKKGSSILNLGGINENYTGDFIFEEGTLNLLANSSYFNAQNTTLNSNIYFNMQNNEINNINFGNLTLNGQSNILADVDFNNKTMDMINANTILGSGDIYVRSLNFEGSPSGEFITIPFANSVLKDYVSYTPQIIETPIYNYNSSYDSSNGYFNFNREGFNSSVYIPAVAAQLAGYLTSIDTYKNVFSNLDMVMINPPSYMKGFINKNRIANSNYQFAFSPLTIPEEQRGIWFKPYSTFENVNLKNGPKVSNVAYGSIIGIESALTEVKNNWYSIYGGYISYNGSHQAFEGNSIYNNGGLLGMDTVFYKGNFFTAWTANIGANSAEAHSRFGSDNFAMLNGGIAEKTGYNFELYDRKLIVQPSLIMSYTFVNTFDYNTKANVNFDSDTLHAIRLEPEIKLIGNFENYLQPYLSVSMVWNIIDKSRFSANDIYLPELSVKPFVQYGAGIQKRWGDRLTGFFEGLIRNGGRNGIALQFGLRISI